MTEYLYWHPRINNILTKENRGFQKRYWLLSLQFEANYLMSMRPVDEWNWGPSTPNILVTYSLGVGSAFSYLIW